MKAGYAKVCITPPLGTRLSGFGGRDEVQGAESVHDDLFVRVAYLESGDERAVLAGFDLLFFAREHADRLKGAAGRSAGLLPRQILLNTSHTHAGPTVDRWGLAAFRPPDLAYLELVETALLRAIHEAQAQAVAVTVRAGLGYTRLPVSRRRPDGKGGVEWRPYPEGTVCRALPFCQFLTPTGETAALIYSVSCHPSTVGGWAVSADYPGMACDKMDQALGRACSVFLQGAGGDTKACVIADGHDDTGPAWRSGTPDDVRRAGELVADDLARALGGAIQAAHKPALTSALVEMEWPLEPPPSRAILSERARSEHPVVRRMAEVQIAHLERWGRLPESARLLAHGIQVADGVRLAAIEGELVGELGLEIMKAFPGGVTFPLGYSNGTGLYLPTSRMLREGGYEADSAHEYGYASRLREGTEARLLEGVAALRDQGIR
jgi:hypothetical protein